jgi:hypothetical protein
MIWTLKNVFRGSFEDLHVLESQKKKPHLKVISRANINLKRV